MICCNYTERQIITVMQFTGFTRNESIDYLNALVDKDNKTIINMEQETKLLDQLIKSSNSQSMTH